MNVTQAALDVCKEALYLLRQDVSLPPLSEAESDTSMEWRKCRIALEYASTEVLSAHDWVFARGDKSDAAHAAVDGWPANIRKLLVYRLAAELAVQIAGRTEDLKNWHTLYSSMLVDARLKDLSEDGTDDPVVREVVAGVRTLFTSANADLPRSMALIYERIGAVRDSAFKEVLSAHNWQGKDEITSGEKLPSQAKAAWIALMQQKLAIVCGLTIEAVGAFESIWRAKLKEARVTDLETSPVPEGIVGDVLTAIRGVFDTSEALPRDLKSLVDRIERMKPIAMREVLSSHPWAFAMEEEVCVGVPHGVPGSGEYRFCTPVPLDSIRVVSVHGRDGRLGHVEEIGGELRCREPIVRIVYIRDVANIERFTPDAYRLVVLKLAADLAKVVAAKPESRELQERLYRDALADAKLRDARGSNPSPKSVWGDNYYVDQMDSGRGRYPWRRR